MAKTSYDMTIAGVKHTLPIRPITEDLQIGAFVIFGNVELTVACAAALLEKAPEFDYMVAPEAKAIPLIHEMARQKGDTYFIVRKKAKAYMNGVFSTEVQSITTAGVQSLFMDGEDAAKMKGKRILIIDDVISTGESLRGVEQLVSEAGGNIVGRMCILAEGDAAKRDDIIFLEKLPLFDKNGEPID